MFFVFRMALLVGCTLIYFSSPGDAEEFPRDMASGGAPGIYENKAIERPLAYRPDEEPSWLEPILKRISDDRGQGWKIYTHMLFRDLEGNPTFLAIYGGGSYAPNFLLYRIKKDTDGRMKAFFLRKETAGLFLFEEPTGMDFDKDGIAHLYLKVGSGGSGSEDYRLKVIRLERNSVDITPEFAGLRPVTAYNLDGMGASELILSDSRWAGFYYGCGACGPYVPFVMEFDGNAYQPACRKHASYFKWYATKNKGYDIDDLEQAPAEFLVSNLYVILALLQGGFIDEGLARYEKTVEKYRVYYLDENTKINFTRTDELYGLTDVKDVLERFLLGFDGVMERVKTEGEKWDCPVSVLGGPVPVCNSCVIPV